MRVILLLLVSFCLLAAAPLPTDPAIASAQQTLKEQGFYYGEAHGRKDADTTAAIRRYQIRNGLQISGELNAETQRALGVKGAIAPPPPRAMPTATPRVLATPEPMMARDDRRPAATPASLPNERLSSLATALAAGGRGIFAGTAYERSSANTQQQVVIQVQTLLARRGYYHDLIDGDFGAGTEFAVRAYQSRFGMAPNGRLDNETLAALGLLPGQKAPGLTAPIRRSWHQPREIVAPNGGRVYEGR